MAEQIYICPKCGSREFGVCPCRRTEVLFEDWWRRDGRHIDPDTDDVPWFDKRKGLAAAAFEAAMAQSRNYVANQETQATRFEFANGRIVTVEPNGWLATEIREEHDQQR